MISIIATISNLKVMTSFAQSYSVSHSLREVVLIIDYLELIGDVKIELSQPLVCRSLSPPAATEGLEQSYLIMIDLNV